nr:MAG: hypothetical protein [Microvirus sp.]
MLNVRSDHLTSETVVRLTHTNNPAERTDMTPTQQKHLNSMYFSCTGENLDGQTIKNEKVQVEKTVLKDSLTYPQKKHQQQSIPRGHSSLGGVSGDDVYDVITNYVNNPNAPYPMAFRVAMENLILAYIG